MTRRPLRAALLAAVVPGAAAAALLAGSTPALAAADAGGPVTVASLVKTADGHLQVRRQRADSSSSGRALAARLRSQAGVVAADVPVPVHASATTPGDPMEGQQWGLGAVGAPVAWSGTDAGRQVVAVVDTGVDLSHPDLAGALLPGDDLVDGDTVPQDQNGHGTHVAGIAAGIGGNGVGIAGTALHAKVLPVRVLDADGGGTSDTVAQGVIWAVDHGATVVNLSLGGPDDDSVLDRAIAYALGKGVPVVAAAGNEAQSGNPVEYPAAVPGVLAVGAVDSSLRHASFSNTGPYVGVVAPGVGIVSTYLGGGYTTLSGTSMATPFVAGAVAMLRATQPSLTPAQVVARLEGTARDLGTTGRDDVYGSGLVDLAAADGNTDVSPGPASRFVPVAPLRLLDTRPGRTSVTGPSHPVGTGGTVLVPVSGVSTAQGVVPADATAVVLNVTAVRPTVSTYVTAYPDGTSPPLASSLNAPAGSIVPNHVTVRLGSTGAVRLRNYTGSVDLVADLEGYYVPAAGGAGEGFAAVAPQRLLDTRTGYAPDSSPKGRVGGGHHVDLPVTGRAGVPVDASAVVLNVTAVTASADSYVTVYPTSASGQVPTASALNLAAGATNANLVTVAVGDAGQVRLYVSGGDVDLVADVAGWYGPSATAQLVPVTPLRLLDTRTGLGAQPRALGEGGTLDLAVAGRRGVPAGASSVLVNLTGVTPTADTYLSAYPPAATPPGTSSVNLAAGDVRANAVSVLLGSGAVRVRNYAGSTSVVADLAGWFEG